MDHECHPPAVEVNIDVMGGTPVFAGSRLPIATVLASLDAGSTLAEVLDSWPWLTAAHVDAARRYATAHDIGVLPWALGVDDVQSVELTVVVSLFPEIRQVRAETQDGWLYAITPATAGVHADELQPGQRLRCQVTRRLPRVLHAELITPEQDPGTIGSS